ncbi:Uncharacterised protein [Campylobacter lari]|nr:Uncharacterised protein [Campylobacter lari]
MDFITNLIIAAIVGGACGAALHLWKKKKEKDSSEK